MPPARTLRWTRTLALLTALEAAAGLAVLAALPSYGEGGMLGFSVSRLAGLAVLVFEGLCALVLLLSLRSAHPGRTERWVKVLSGRPVLHLLSWTVSLLLAAAGLVLLPVLGVRRGFSETLVLRLAPLLVCAGLLGLQGAALLIIALPAASRRDLVLRTLRPLLRWKVRVLDAVGDRLAAFLHRLDRSRATARLRKAFPEARIYPALAGLLWAAYLAAGLLAGTGPIAFGIGHFRAWGAGGVALWLLAAGLLAWLARSRREAAVRLVRRATQAVYSSPLTPLLFALACGGFYYALRSRFLNNDALQFTEKFLRDVPLYGAHISVDEIGELVLHSRFWVWTSQAFGWSVLTSYQALTLLAGVVFTWILLLFARELAGRDALPVFVLALAGGYMQLFFGDIENYTLSAACLAAYLYLAVRCLDGKSRLEWAAGTYVLALGLHLLAGFLLPSLVYLFYQALRRGEEKALLRACGIMLLLGGGIAAGLLWSGFPLAEQLRRSHAATALAEPGRYLARWTAAYAGDMLSLLLLLAPLVIFLPGLILHGRIRLEPRRTFLLFCALSMAAYQLLWRAQMGVVQDWNLYAAAGMIYSLLLAPVLLEVPTLRRHPALLVLAWAAMGAHSLGWILSNHLLPAAF